MIALDWKPLGINVDNQLENEINVHNGAIMEKTDHFEDIVISSSTDNKEKYLKLFNEQRGTLAIITAYHDIGKAREKLNHGEHSYDIIQETDILAEHNLDEERKTLIKSIIRHHLVLGTMFTGEWSAKKLYVINKQIDSSLSNPDLFFDLLVIFSVLDAWAYVDDKKNAIRLFNNYDRIIQRFKQDSIENHIKLNQIWRFCCFLGAWKSVNYLDKKIMRQYEERLGMKIKTRYDCGEKGVREEIWQRFMALENVNFQYAIWLLGNCCFASRSQCDRNNFDDIQIDDSLFCLIEDVAATVNILSSKHMWEVLFTGYRESMEKAEHVFQNVKNSEKLDKVIKEKIVDQQKRQITYRFDLL
jgi:hypothetical protein